MPGKLDRLQSRVGSVTRLSRVRGVVLGLALAALVMGGAFLAASVFDIALRLGGATRALLLAASVILAVWAVIRSRRGAPADDSTAAREVERSFPEIESSLSTAIEYGSDAEKTAAYSSPEIVDGLVEVAETRTRPLPFRRAVDWRAVRRAGAGLCAVGVVVLLYGLFLPHMAASTAARFWNPFSDTAPPTWTVILSVDPGSREVARGERVPLRARLGGSRPDSVRVLYRGEGDAAWLASNMSADTEGGAEDADGGSVFVRTLRVTRRTEYRVVAGDAESPTFRLWPVEAPRVEAIRVTVVPPEYTGLPAEDLPEGAGDVRAVEGSRVEVRIRTNRRITNAELAVSLGKGTGPAAEPKRSSVALSPVAAEEGAGKPEADDGLGGPAGMELAGAFTLSESGEYRVRLEDAAGRTNSHADPYRLTAVPDRPPVVKVTEPDKDVSAHKARDVKVEIEATDDHGIREVGIVHTLTGKPVRHSVERPAVGTKKTESEYPIRLALAGLKGGEIITYYPFAVDSKGSEIKGDVRFLYTYDKERYGDMPGEEKKRPPRAVREVGRLVEKQKDLTRETFSAARKPEPPKAREASSARSARGQDDLRRDLDELVREVEEEIETRSRSAAGEGNAEEAGMSPEEIDLMKEASRDMAAASESLRSGEMDSATASQSKALSALSRTRRLLLSESSSSDASQALAQAGERREQKRREERKRKLDEFRDEMAKLPPMLDREEKERRKLEQLEDEPPPPGQAGGMADEQRRLAEEARKLADKMDELRRGDPSMPQEPSRRLMEAADRAERAARNIERGDSRSAARAASQASKNMRDAKASGDRAMRNIDRDTLKGAATDAEEIAREQSELARESARAAAEARARDQEREKSGQETGHEKGAQATRESGQKDGDLKTGEQETGEQKGERSGEQAGAKTDGKTKDLAARQEELAGRMEELESRIESLAENAAQAGRAEVGALRQADLRRMSADASGLMREAAEHLSGGVPEVAEAPQRIAAQAAKSLAGDLRRAARVAERSEREDLAAAIRRAEELAEDIARLEREAGDASSDPKPAASMSRQLGKEARDIGEIASRLPSKGRADDMKKARESLDRAGRRLADGAKALDMKDRAGGSAASRDAREEAERAASALKRSASADLARELAAARDAAQAAAREQASAREAAEAARDATGDRQEDKNGDKKGDAGGNKARERSRARAARAQRDAERNAREAAEKLASAAQAAGGAGSELAEWISREAQRAEREGLPGMMGDLASRFETPMPKDDSEAEQGKSNERSEREARDARELEKAAGEAAGRFDSLVAEAKGDDVEALRAAGEDAKRMAERLRDLEREIEDFRKGDPSKEGESRSERSHKLGGEARETAEDSESLRERIGRRAGELLRDAEGDAREGKGVERDMDRARTELERLERALSRNQTLPRPSNALAAAARAYQIVGDGIIAKVERILREREYRPPEDEEAPEEFRELVDRYFRALSEDH